MVAGFVLGSFYVWVMFKRVFRRVFSRRFLIWAIGVVGVLWVGLAVVYAVFNSRVEDEWAELLEDWRAYDSDFDGVLQGEQVADEDDFVQDAWVVKAVGEGGLGNIGEMKFEGVELEYSSGGEDRWRSMFSEKEFVDERAAAEHLLSLLGEYEEMIGGVESALKRKQSLRRRLRDDATLGNFITDRPEMKVLGLGRFFADRAELYLEAGNGEAAFQDLERIHQLMLLISDEIDLVRFLVLGAQGTVFNSILEKGIQKGNWDEQQLLASGGMMDSWKWKELYLKSYRGEVVHSKVVIKLLEEHGFDSLEEATMHVYKEELEEMFEDADESWFDVDELMVWVVSSLTPRNYFLSQNVALQRQQLIDCKLLEAYGPTVDGKFLEELANVERHWKWYDFSAASIHQTLSKQARFIRRSQAQSRVAEVAVALARYRLGAGELPGKLESLVPEFLDEVPRDPFSDGVISYDAEKGECWSAGPTPAEKWGEEVAARDARVGYEEDLRILFRLNGEDVE